MCPLQNIPVVAEQGKSARCLSSPLSEVPPAPALHSGRQQRMLCPRLALLGESRQDPTCAITSRAPHPNHLPPEEPSEGWELPKHLGFKCLRNTLHLSESSLLLIRFEHVYS